MSNRKKRKGNGEGTVYHNGRYWTGQLTTGRDPYTGKIIRKSLYGKTKKEVLEKMAEVRKMPDSVGNKVESEIILKRWAEHWLESFKKPIVAESTFDRYKSMIERHIVYPLGQEKLCQIDAFKIQNLINSLSEGGLSPGTVAAVRSRLNDMFEKAVETGILDKNPCKGVVLPRKSVRNSPIALTINEQELLIRHCLNAKNGDLFIFLLGTGMRIGEALALTWGDIDFVKEQITIRRSAGEIRGRAKIYDRTKTPAGTRVIPMNREVKYIIGNIYYRQAKEKNTFNLVFPTSEYTISLSSNIRARLSRYCKEAGIRKISVHTLRHTFATRAIEQNINIKVLSHILGHRDTKVTLNTYAHALPDFIAEEYARIDVFLSSTALKMH